LGHPHDSAEDPKTEGDNGGDARWKQTRVLIDSKVVPGKAAFEEKVLYEGDAFVDGEPVTLGERLFVSEMVRGTLINFYFSEYDRSGPVNREGYQERDAEEIGFKVPTKPFGGEKGGKGGQRTITNMKFSNTDTKWPYPGIAMAQ